MCIHKYTGLICFHHLHNIWLLSPNWRTSLRIVTAGSVKIPGSGSQEELQVGSSRRGESRWLFLRFGGPFCGVLNKNTTNYLGSKSRPPEKLQCKGCTGPVKGGSLRLILYQVHKAAARSPPLTPLLSWPWKQSVPPVLYDGGIIGFKEKSMRKACDTKEVVRAKTKLKNPQAAEVAVSIFS